MYNLLVSSDPNDWEGNPFSIPQDRCVKAKEYTNEKIAEKFGALESEHVDELLLLPCIFAYEDGHNKPPKFGRLRSVKRVSHTLEIEYEIIYIAPFIEESDLSGDLATKLEIPRLEMYRTHWAVKDVSLISFLMERNLRNLLDLARFTM